MPHQIENSTQKTTEIEVTEPIVYVPSSRSRDPGMRPTLGTSFIIELSYLLLEIVLAIQIKALSACELQDHLI